MEVKYGADVTRNQFIKLAFALCLGTLVEWYDFTVYSQLSNIITQIFFPPSDPVMAQISFWAVYAVGYIARPLGALIFGHIGDSYGRRITLLISVLLITLPTLLIGCLPTYKMIGLAAPVLMALLRFIQGIAVGGEFGSAITYLYELAAPGHKGFTASLGQVAVSPGIILGILVCQAVLYGCTPEQLLVWGWRVPFLVTVITAPLALYLRLHMPEPFEFLKDKQQQVLQRVASTAAQRAARSFSRQHSSLGGVGSFTRHSSTARALSALRLSSLSPSATQQAPAGAAADHQRPLSPQGSSAGVCLRQLSARQLSLQLQRSVSITADGRLVRDAVGGKQQQQDGLDKAWPELAGCEQEFHHEVEQLSGVIKRHRPLTVLFRDHWLGVLLQFLLEACYGTTFYTFFTWAPSYMSKALHVKASNTLWALLLGMLLFAAACPLAGRFVGDTRVPKIWAFLAMSVLLGVVALPVMVVLQSGHAVGLWLLLPLMLGATGALGGVMTTIGPQIYPPAVRASGYNIGHNLSMSLFGGLVPLIISALSVVLQPSTNSAGVVVVMSAVLSVIAGVALIKVVPAANAACPAGQHVEHLEQQEQKRKGAPALHEVVVPSP